MASDVGDLSAGQQLTAHVAQFVSVREGKIASVETYDCYQPFRVGRAASRRLAAAAGACVRSQADDQPEGPGSFAATARAPLE